MCIHMQTCEEAETIVFMSHLAVIGGLAGAFAFIQVYNVMYRKSVYNILLQQPEPVCFRMIQYLYEHY